MRWQEDELLTVAEIAAVLRVSQQTIRNWIDAGRIAHVRVGERRVRVWRSDLQAFLNTPQMTRRSAAHPAAEEPSGSIWDGVIPAPVTPPGG